MFKRSISICLLTVITILSGCFLIAHKKENPVSRDFFAMDTYVRITVCGSGAEPAAESAKAEMLRLERLLSAYGTESETALLQKKRAAAVSEDLAVLLARSISLHKETGGAFDITLSPVSKLWGFPHGPYHVPGKAEIKNALAATGMGAIRWDGASRQCALNNPLLSLDFGGIAKGYAAEKMAAVLKEKQIRHALLDLGGNIKAIGAKPDSSPWRIAIRHPDHKNGYLGVLSVTDTSVVTSGDYERYFEKGNVRYHHILDPETGAPARSGIRSATIVCDDCTTADGLSTALFVMGPEEAAAFWKKHKDEFQFILFTQDQTLYVTEGLLPLFASELSITPVK